MRIIVIFQGGFPNGGAMSKRLFLYCKGLIEKGHFVKIVIPNATENYNKVSLNLISNGIYNDIPYEYLSKTTKRSSSFLKRRLNDFFGYLRLCYYLLLKKNKADIYFIVDIRNFLPAFIYIISRIRSSKMIYELNEHPTIITGRTMFWINKKTIYPLYDGFIVISKQLFNLVTTFRNAKARSIVIPILTEEKKVTYDGIPKIDMTKPYILHTGTITERKDGVFGMIKAFKIVNAKGFNIKFYFSGSLTNSDEHIQLKKIIADEGLNNSIKFLGYLPEDELIYYQSNCKLAIINKLDNLQNAYCFPTKLGEYLSFARPIIITNVGVAKDLFVNNVNAYLVDSNNHIQLADKIIDILDHPNKSKEIGEKGKELADFIFNYKIQSANVSRFFEDMIIN